MKTESDTRNLTPGRAVNAGQPDPAPQFPIHQSSYTATVRGRASRRCEELPLQNGSVNLSRGEVRRGDGSRCDLSAREVDLLRYLAANAGRVVSRDEILMEVWRLDPQQIITRTIDMHVAHLRGKLGDSADRPEVLLTVHGYGYMFKAAAA
ncbi:MAG: winged helix-turn-helix transcriptional regulator [Verrucomicrobia bacterium]|nr:winged helix-turn-helix transcriptional regulator [Verrucomicrobiota bacterium]